MSTTEPFLVKLKVVNNGTIELVWICPYKTIEGNDNMISIADKIILTNNLMSAKVNYDENETTIMSYLRNLKTPLCESIPDVNKNDEDNEEI